MNITIFPEICCDYCCEVIHNHMVCPNCKNDYAPTSKYGSITERWDDDGDDFFSIEEILECEDCHAKFELLEKPVKWDTATWEWKQTKP